MRRTVAMLLGCWSLAACAAARGGDGASAAQSSTLAPISNDAASPSTSPAATPTAPAAAFAGSCFSWVHLADFSTDCFRSRAECESERKQMVMGGRDTAPCEAASHASCTLVGDDAGDGDERCFGTKSNCGRYRLMLARRGVHTTDCVDR